MCNEIDMEIGTYISVKET